MTETEREELATLARDAHDRNGATWAQVVDAIVARVREMDAAWGGTLSAEDLETHAEAIRKAFVVGAGERHRKTAWKSMDRVLSHAAAQGRRIAALEAELAKARERIAELEREVIAEASRAEMHGRAEGYALETKGHWRARALSAESALATLRQAVEDQSGNIERALSAERSKARPSQARIQEMEFAAAALSPITKALGSTPAPEHPDTATTEEGGMDELLALVRRPDVDTLLRMESEGGKVFVVDAEDVRELADDAATLRAIRDWAERRRDFFLREHVVGHNHAREEVRKLLGDPGQARGGEVVCRPCSEAGGAERNVSHEPPACHPNTGDSSAEVASAEDWRILEAWVRDGLDPTNQRHAALTRLRSRNLP